MSLLDDLGDLEKSSDNRQCKMIKTVTTSLSAQELAAFLALLTVPAGDPSRVSAINLVKALSKGNIRISGRSIERHRAQQCPCYV